MLIETLINPTLIPLVNCFLHTKVPMGSNDGGTGSASFGEDYRVFSYLYFVCWVVGLQFFSVKISSKYL